MELIIVGNIVNKVKKSPGLEYKVTIADEIIGHWAVRSDPKSKNKS